MTVEELGKRMTKVEDVNKEILEKLNHPYTHTTNLFLQYYVLALQCGDKNYKTVITMPLTWHWWEC